MSNSEDTKKGLLGSFETPSENRVKQDYAADSDLAKSLLVDLRKMLSASATARRLIQMGDEQGVSVKFLRGREEAAYVPENKWIFMSVTPKTRANATLALLYAGALREAEQNILGYKRPGTEVDDNTWYGRNLQKNLDIIINLCTITKEITEQNQGDVDFLDSLRGLGHDEYYKAFVNQASYEELVKLITEKELKT